MHVRNVGLLEADVDRSGQAGVPRAVFLAIPIFRGSKGLTHKESLAYPWQWHLVPVNRLIVV